MSGRKFFLGLILVFIASSFFVAPVIAELQVNAGVTQDYDTITVAEAKELIANTTGLIIYDVRTQLEFDDGYIRGASLIPHDEINTTVNDPTDNASVPILVYCKYGGRGANASRDLAYMGYTNVSNMDGGFEGWKTAGYWYEIPVLTARLMLNATDADPDLFLLDVRYGYEFADGYVRGTSFNPNTVLIPYDEIESMTDELPTDKTDPILVYCKKGGRGSTASQTLEDLGYTKVMNMAGGFDAWMDAGFYFDIPVTKAKDMIRNATIYEDFFLLDVRAQSEYDEHHIRGTNITEMTVLIPHLEIKDNTDKLPSNKSAPIIVYCKLGGRGSNASQQLENLGYTWVMNMAGGITAWREAGYFVDVSVARAKELYDAPEVHVLDVRNYASDEYEAGHAEGAYLIPHVNITDRADELPSIKSHPILVYCKAGYRGSIASQALEDLGYTNVSNIHGGFDAWAAAGYSNVTTGSFVKPEYDTISVVEAKEYIANTTGLFILDARTQDEYDDAHLENSHLIPHDEILNKLSDLPTDKSTPILVYCKYGGRGAKASWTLVLLGYTEVYNMDGGITDWIDAGYPVLPPPEDTDTTTTTTTTTTTPTSGFTASALFILFGVIAVSTVIRRRKK